MAPASTALTRARAAKKPTPVRKRRRAPSEDASSDGEQEADAEELVAKVSRDSRRSKGKRTKAAGSILAEFTSLDALLDNDLAEKRKKQTRERKLQKLREESEAAAVGAREGGSSPLGKLMTHMASSMSSLTADSHLFAATELPLSEEKFGYVFTPITAVRRAPLPYHSYTATETELSSDLKLVYKTMQSPDATELSGLLWSKAIVVRCLFTQPAKPATRNAGATPSSPVMLPAKIGSWLFMTMSTHSNSQVIGGCFSNLFLVMSSSDQVSMSALGAGLPFACFTQPIEDFRAVFGAQTPPIAMEWQPSIYDFLNAFRAYGFQDSKRSMSVKSKIPATPPSAEKAGKKAKRVLPFPTLNMQFVLMYLVLCLRTKSLKLEGYDAFSFTMFFLRMQFEADMHASIVDLATICIEELLDVFPRAEWRKEWAPQLVLRIAGASEGLFDSAAGWLAVARRLPRTMRGTQLTTGLSIYVLQHRIDKKPQEDEATSERPLKFPIQSGLVLDIVAGIVEDLTAKYAETRKSGKAAKTAPPFDLLCKKVALMDLALQAFLNILTHKEMALMLSKLDQLAGAHKSTMSAKWHELKTLVSLMHRKYSLDNLRVGRSSSPSAKAVLFCDDDDDE
ncbi:hypothetical protein BBJ28_00021060 [Nothophytophthora sp. Chile5]|nr:hypothetical protein BBJ28_00021060 [Nothophytophthora sp. Chile5]